MSGASTNSAAVRGSPVLADPLTRDPIPRDHRPPQGLRSYSRKVIISEFSIANFGHPSGDAEIQNFKQPMAADKVGPAVVEYNRFANRGSEGFYNVLGRRGCGDTWFDYARMKDLPPLQNEVALKVEETCSNIAYFRKAIVSVAD
jgi:hypothetical protein